VFIEQDAGFGVTQQPCQRGLAIEERAIAQILAVMFDEVEGIEDRGIGGLPTAGSSHGFHSLAKDAIGNIARRPHNVVVTRIMSNIRQTAID
jgi:hypothetical protein